MSDWKKRLRDLEIRSYDEEGGFTSHVGSLDNVAEVESFIEAELKRQCKEIREWARANSWTDYDTNTQILRFTDLNSLLDSLEEKA